MIRGLLNRRWILALLWVLISVLAAFSLNLLGIQLIGSVNGWTRWLASHRGCFMAWRLCVYAATAYGWWWMRQRVLQREPSTDTHRRLLCTEIAAVLAILALESAVFLTSP